MRYFCSNLTQTPVCKPTPDTESGCYTQEPFSPMRIIYCNLSSALLEKERRNNSLEYIKYVNSIIPKYFNLVWDLNQHKNCQSCSVETHLSHPRPTAESQVKYIVPYSKPGRVYLMMEFLNSKKILLQQDFMFCH